MKVTRQRKDTERRLVITLGRHERATAKTIIIGRIRGQKNNLKIAQECGALVRHEFQNATYHHLYFIGADEFFTPNELVKQRIQADLDAGFLIKTEAGVVPATVAHLPGFIDLINDHALNMEAAFQGVSRLDNTRRVTPVLFGHCAPQPGTDRESFEEWREQFKSENVQTPFNGDLDDKGRSIGSRGADGFYSPRIDKLLDDEGEEGHLR